MTQAVHLEGVTKRFGDRAAVEALSLAVPPGSIYGFLGPNGAGKTTTLRMMIGILYPDAGRLRILGQPDAAAVRARLGYLPEERGLYEKMRLLDVVAYFGQLKGMGARQARARADRLLVDYGLGDWRLHRCRELSRGMAQKAQLLATILHEPELLVLDEPFSGLDPVNRDLMQGILLDFRRQGRTVVFSTHIMEQAEQLCDYVLLIDRGRKVLDGRLSEVRSSGGQAVRLDYDGQLPPLPGVRRANDAGKQAELFLEEGADPQRVLEALVAAGVRVRRFDLRELSLHEIFVRAVGRPNGGGESHG